MAGGMPDCRRVEIELSDNNAEVTFPPALKVLREVTRDPAFKNAALAKLA